LQGLFSKRYEKALSAKKIPFPTFSRVLRTRLAMVCRDHAEYYEDFGTYSDTMRDAVGALRKAYGKESLRVQDEKKGGDRNASGFEDFIVYAYPHHVLDALEAFYRLLPDPSQHPFQAELNGVLAEEGSPWRMTDGHMYMVDSRFLDALRRESEENMRREGFLGAHEEFQDARSYLQAGNADDAIHKANCAFESALKSVLNQKEGTADQLLKKLREETDLLNGVPEETQKAIVSTVLQGLPVLRHKIGGHGQGPDALDVPLAFGDLAVNLSASYIKFLADLKKELSPPRKSPPAVEDDEIPF